MCGVFGFTGRENKKLLLSMAESLKHRGPDGEGYFTSPGINLGHRRLAIVDLATGDQPLYSEDRKIVLVANAEIYNYQDLREKLKAKGHIFKTNTDCEVIVHAYEEWGDEFISRLNGSFAIALWDAGKKRLLLVRDRLGIRPLHYALKKDGLIFASETKAILLDESIKKTLNEGSLKNYLSLRYVPGEETMFRPVNKLLPGHKLVYQSGKAAISSYWQLNYQQDNSKDLSTWAGEFEALLEDAVRLRLMSDVGYGAFLSGGLDSSSIVSLMSKYSKENVKTYAIGFGTDIDETDAASNVANILKTRHETSFLEKTSFRDLPEIISHLDEPIGDAIIMPTYSLSRQSSNSEKVILTGEGADEILAGYVHQLAMNYLSLLNPGFGIFLSGLVRLLPAGLLNKLFPYPALLGESGKKRLIKYLSNLASGAGSYLALSELFSVDEIAEFYPGYQPSASLEQGWQGYFENDKAFLNQLIDLDLKNWLPDYTLYKQDRLTMANSQEGRVPFLDHRLVELCARLPVNYKINSFEVKFLLREVSKNILPEEISQAKKKAFYLPTEKVFGEDFYNYVREVLLEGALISKLSFRKEKLEAYLAHFQGEEILPNKKVIALLILALWAEKNL